MKEDPRVLRWDEMIDAECSTMERIAAQWRTAGADSSVLAPLRSAESRRRKQLQILLGIDESSIIRAGMPTSAPARPPISREP